MKIICLSKKNWDSRNGYKVVRIVWVIMIIKSNRKVWLIKLKMIKYLEIMKFFRNQKRFRANNQKSEYKVFILINRCLCIKYKQNWKIWIKL